MRNLSYIEMYRLARKSGTDRADVERVYRGGGGVSDEQLARMLVWAIRYDVPKPPISPALRADEKFKGYVRKWEGADL
jgi:hypothetical protein